MGLRKNKKYPGRDSIRYRGTECRNCGHSLDKSDRYCPYCSQANSTKNITLGEYFSEFFSSIFVYDSRLRYTLRDIFYPGRMTKNYVLGQRMKYANPFKFFLSISILYFLINGFISDYTDIDGLSSNEAFKEADSVQLSTPGSFLSIKMDTPRVFILEDKGDTLKAKELGMTQYYSENELQAMSFLESRTTRAAVYMDFQYSYPRASASEALKRMEHLQTRENKWFYGRVAGIKKIIENEQGFVSSMQQNFPFFLFFFTPFFALFFLLFFSRKKFKYMDHLILLFHVISFFFLIYLFIRLSALFIDTTFLGSLFLFIVFPIYLVLTIKRFYCQSFWKAFYKTFLLGIFFNFSFLIAILIFIFGSVLSY